jgi:ABC-type nitrate/sulfonate/bicarbonate transport system ATPase subunit
MPADDRPAGPADDRPPGPVGAAVGAGAVTLRAVSHRWPSGGSGPSSPALDGIDLEVVPGEVVALVGPSGCGKSTLLRILAGLTVPTEGTAEVDGRSVVGRPGSCAWMPQHHGLVPWRRVLANATLGAEVGGRSRSEAEARARPLLERFGLGGYERAWPAELSGGMRQRLAVLRTVLVDAPVLALDEPFGSLDAITRRSLQTWFQEVLGADGAGPGAGRRTALVVTHDVEEAVLLADRVVVLSPRPGRVVADVAVTLPRPRPPSLVTEPEVVALRARLLDALGA